MRQDLYKYSDVVGIPRTAYISNAREKLDVSPSFFLSIYRDSYECCLLYLWAHRITNDEETLSLHKMLKSGDPENGEVAKTIINNKMYNFNYGLD